MHVLSTRLSSGDDIESRRSRSKNPERTSMSGVVFVIPGGFSNLSDGICFYYFLADLLVSASSSLINDTIVVPRAFAKLCITKRVGFVSPRSTMPM